MDAVITHPHDVLCSAENKRRYFEECSNQSVLVPLTSTEWGYNLKFKMYFSKEHFITIISRRFNILATV